MKALERCEDVLAESKAYRDLESELLATVVGGERVQNGGKLLSVELDYIHLSAGVPSSFTPAWSLTWLRPTSDSSRGKGFLRTVNDGTNDLVDLSILGRLGACESLAKSRGEGRLEWLEGASWAAESRSSQRPGDAAVRRNSSAVWSSQWSSGWTVCVPLEHCDGY